MLILGLIPTESKESWKCKSAVTSFGEDCIPHDRLAPFNVKNGLLMEDFSHFKTGKVE